MRSGYKIGGYLAGLAVVFTAALGVGQVAGGPATPTTSTDQPGHGHGTTGSGHTSESGTPQSGENGAGTGPTRAAVPTRQPGGLTVAQDGYRLVPLTATLATGTTNPFSFRVLGPDGNPVTAYTPTHDKNLHLIVVRRDLAGFQHVHPQMAADGTWSVPLTIASAGPMRLIADFQPAARPDNLTLGVDIPAPGDYRPVPLPATGRSASAGDGYTVTLDGDLEPGTSSTLTLTVSRYGTPVTNLEPYLAAYGHLVALRDGDLAYLHVHPNGGPGDGRTPSGPAVTFEVEVPSAGAYRLYLEFQHLGAVRTAEFTVLAGAPGDSHG
ncbi:hypothetical protein BDK92_3811 [Micromonospora pisi]|uniref:Secreted protein n=1 Tax=Micromonospora pisi TaxID=589240 RepID=A0A495JKM1_9ACTN|nr:hypothetical protein [Micromonospora pisi]RKR89463.1 hypothetical protein BDK92_3811 [Micromonospora pisi]